MATQPKDRLHRLVDALPVGELAAAERYLEFLAGLGHPFVQTLLNAPEAAEPLSEGDRESLAEDDAPLKQVMWSPIASCAPNSGYDVEARLDPPRSQGHEEARTDNGAPDPRGGDRAG